MLKDIRRMLFVALLALFLGVSLLPLGYAATIRLTLNSTPIKGVKVWYSTKPGGTSGGPYTTDTAIDVSPSNTAPPFPGIGSYKISYELYPDGFVLSHFIVDKIIDYYICGEREYVGHGNATAGYKNQTVWSTKFKPVIRKSEKVYLNNVLQRRNADYTIDYERGLINFTKGGAPLMCTKITAEYIADPPAFKAGYKQDVVHCILGEVDVGYLRESLFAPTIVTTVEAVYEPIGFGPKIDKLRFKVVKSPDAELIQMQTCQIDVLTDLIRTGDIVKLDGDGFTITAAPGFHMGHIGINIRPDQTYKDPAHGSPNAGPVLSDVNFRHALFHVYNQEEIVASLYGFIATPVQSLVPPSQGGFVNPNVPKHPYNPGSPTATTKYPEDHSACGILRYGGYVWCTTHSCWAVPHDLDGDGTPGTTHQPDCTWIITDHDDELRRFTPGLRVFTPTYETAPTSAEHGRRFCDDANAIGIPLFNDTREFAPYLDLVFGTEGVPGGEFDLYMAFWSLGKFPDHLYDMCISTQDTVTNPGAYNAPGIHCDELDEAVSTIKFSLDHDAKIAAAYKAQMMLYNETYTECAFAYMQLYSRIYFNAFKPGLKGIVNSPGFGSDNDWTFLNMHWESGHPNERYHQVYTDKSLIIWCLGEVPERLNPTYAHTVYAWEIIGSVLDGLMSVNPYTHEDLGWIAWDWEVEEWATEDDVDEFLAGAVLDSHWHEDWPVWSQNRYMILWTDEDASGTLTIGDQVKFDDPWWHPPPIPEYNVNDMTWDIKVENKLCPWNEMKLSGTDPLLPRPPTQIMKGGMISTMWHEEWPVRSRKWHVDAVDHPGEYLSRSQQIMLNGTWWHVDSVTVTLHLDDKRYPKIEINRVMEFAGTGMKLLYWLRDDVYWQCGNRFTAQDVKFNWLFLRDNQIPRYTSMWENLVDVATVGPACTDHFKVIAYLNVTSQFLLYDFAGTAAMLPPWVWASLDGRPLTEILAYAPTDHPELPCIPEGHWYRVEYPCRPVCAGPWFGERDAAGQPIGAVTQLYGTGPFIFEYYDPVLMYAEMHANRRYFMPTVKIQREKSEMFHAIGDADWDGEVGPNDLNRIGRSYGYFCWEPGFDAQADVNQDNQVNMRDITMLAFFWGDKREYPYPQDP